MAGKNSILDIDTQIEKLHERRKELLVKSAERFARAATKSGLAEMDIADTEIDQIISEITTRFRERKKRNIGDASAASYRKTNGGTGASTEVARVS
ncbi:TraC family protein [Brucella tritici]|uniref:Pilus assembly protein n=1 Tax=Brucella tritici TaxID=94626 RepID=A0A6L3YSD6_9HYPH|nr:TraC family protein [Brucella tritici]KAB2686621.1 pilus assembly protein [Brucella tritici]